MQTFDLLESEVRGYCRSWPVVFSSAEGCTLVDEHGRHYVDFFAGAGALNYGHNHPTLIDALLGHLARNGVVHGLDMATTTKRDFLVKFDEMVLKPRGLEYKLQFPGPTGTNAVEAALKLARKVTGRESVISFTNAFHGMTLGALAVTGDSFEAEGVHVEIISVERHRVRKMRVTRLDPVEEETEDEDNDGWLQRLRADSDKDKSDDESVEPARE